MPVDSNDTIGNSVANNDGIVGGWVELRLREVWSRMYIICKMKVSEEEIIERKEEEEIYEWLVNRSSKSYLFSLKIVAGCVGSDIQIHTNTLQKSGIHFLGLFSTLGKVTLILSLRLWNLWVAWPMVFCSRPWVSSPISSICLH